MANMQVKDGAAAEKYIGAEGAGSDVDPYLIRRILEGGYGHVGKEIVMPSGTATHAANDAIAHTTADATTHNLPLAGRKVGGSGAIFDVAIVTDNPLWATGINVIIYDGVGPGAYVADNAVFDFMYADKAVRVGEFQIASFAKLTGGTGAAAFGVAQGYNRPFKCASDSQNLYFQAYTPVTSTAQVAGQKFYIDVGLMRD